MTTGRINQVATIRYVVVVVLLGLVVWTNVMIDPYIQPKYGWGLVVGLAINLYIHYDIGGRRDTVALYTLDIGAVVPSHTLS